MKKTILLSASISAIAQNQYFVNDTIHAEDMFCTAPGSSGSSGTSAGSPKASHQGLTHYA